MKNGRRRVVVTGIGLVSPLAVGTQPTWQAILDGHSGIAPITHLDAARYATRFAGEVKHFDPLDWLAKKDVKKCGRFIQLALAGTSMAMAASGVQIDAGNASRVGVTIGSGIGGFEVIEREHRTLLERGPKRVSLFFIIAALVNLAAGQVAVRFGAKGPNSAVATACTTGADAIGDAFRLIQNGYADAMICGGTEASVTPLGIAGFSAMRALSARNDAPECASRPWDRDRDGFVVGEGAGILILEAREHAQGRGAPVLAELVGYGMTADAHHVTAPPEDGEGVARARDLHATRRQRRSGSHRACVRRACDVAVSSTKSMTGHLLGAAGAVAAGITVLALRDQIAAPTTNLEVTAIDTALNLIAHRPAPMAMTHAMTNSFGFGGTNASLIFSASTTND